MLGDSEIMQSTVVNAQGVQFVLPDGQVMEGSKPQNAGEIEVWCTAVRKNLEIVHANQQNKRGASRKDRKPESKPSPEPVAESGDDAFIAEDAEAYAQRQLVHWKEEHAKLTAEVALFQTRLTKATGMVQSWTKILEALT